VHSCKDGDALHDNTLGIAVHGSRSVDSSVLGDVFLSRPLPVAGVARARK
jgi:hypothetical protein